MELFAVNVVRTTTSKASVVIEAPDLQQAEERAIAIAEHQKYNEVHTEYSLDGLQPRRNWEISVFDEMDELTTYTIASANRPTVDAAVTALNIVDYTPGKHCVEIEELRVDAVI